MITKTRKIKILQEENEALKRELERSSLYPYKALCQSLQKTKEQYDLLIEELKNCRNDYAKLIRDLETLKAGTASEWRLL